MGAEQRNTGKAFELFKSDFNLEFYDPNKLSVDEVETHVKAFFGEKLLRPRREMLWVGKDGVLDPDYVAMMQRSIEYWQERGDWKAASRFGAELEGSKNAVTLILESNKKNLGEGPVPIVINASDPGDFYVDKEGKKKSVTFVWMLESKEEEGWKYKVYSLPTKFIGLKEHWNLLERLGNVQRTEEILKKILTEPDANSLVAFPVILDELNHNLDEIAVELGYPNWKEIEEMAADQLALENDNKAPERREKIASDFMMRIFFAVKDRKDKKYKEALVAAMSDTMALEAGGEYLGWEADRIEREIDKNVRLALALEYKVFEKLNYSEVNNLGIRFGDLHDLFKHYSWMNNAFRTNPLAQEARATGCGGSGSNYSNTLGWGDWQANRIDQLSVGMGDLFNDQFNNYRETTTEIDSSSGGEEPEGKYAEGVYKPGHCRACDKDRQKVWHKEDGGCDCCTTCEHRLS